MRTKELIARAKYGEKHILAWLKQLYKYWKPRPIAKVWCEIIEDSGILEI